jgi:AraC family transcriptional regulator
MSVTPLCRKLFISTMDAQISSSYWLDRPLEVLSRVSSRDRGWAGFQASLIRVAGGSSQPAVLARHNVTMLVGRPLSTVAKCDGVIDARLQSAGVFDFLPANSTVAWVDRGSSLFLAVGLEQELLRRTALEMSIDPDRMGFAPRLTCRDPQIEHLLWALKAELEADDPHGRLYADSLGVALASQLLRRWSHLVPERRSGGLTGAQLKRVLSYIHDRIDDDLTLMKVAGVAGVSPSHFNLLFRQSVGVPVHRFVMRKRIERAVELLMGTQMPVCDIALKAGFANQSHLALRMRCSLGVTPKELRESR